MKHLLFACIYLLSCPAWSEMLVVTTIPPLKFILDEFAGDDIEVRTLLSAQAEPHHHSMRVSEVILLEQADLVLWVGPQLETYLSNTIAKLNPEKVITASALPDIEKSVTTSGDSHIWLNPDHARVIASEVAGWIVAREPALQARILADSTRFNTALTTLAEELAVRLAPLKQLNILVDHNAFYHFFLYFGLNEAVSLKTKDGLAKSAGQLRHVLDRAAHDCVIAEPHSSHHRMQHIAANANAPLIVLDPLGGNIEASRHPYRALLEQLATDLEKCLQPNHGSLGPAEQLDEGTTVTGANQVLD